MEVANLAGQRKPESARKPAPRRRARRLLIGAIVALALIGGGALGAAFAEGSLPGALPARATAQTSLIFDRYGHRLTAVPGAIDHQPVSLAQIPRKVRNAFVAVEDRRFYRTGNDGIDLRGIARAAVNDLRGQPTQGASTIAEQLVKMLYLHDNGSIVYKLKEIWLGLEVAQRYSKNDILSQYLNLVYLGQGAYGVQAAALTYFGVPVARVDLPQAALLAGLTQAPSAYDPRVDPGAARTRRNTVLALMAKQGYITAEQADAAEAAPLELSSAPAAVAGGRAHPAAWFVDAVVRQLEQTDHLTAQQVAGGGLRIHTTFDPKVQAAADHAVAALNGAGGAWDPGASPVLQAAEVVLDPQTGDVLAIVGGRQHTGAMAFDRALQAERQPGSAIKPLAVYTPALLSGLTPGTVVDDSLQTYGSGRYAYTPVNDNGLYYGLTTLTEALRRSVNTVAVKVLHHIGVETGLQNAQRMGLPLTQRDDHLSLALGGTADCCTPLDMADAYATLANGGYHVAPRLITRVVGPDGTALVNNPVQRRRVLPANVAYVMTKMLETVDEPQPNQGWDVLSGRFDSNWGTGYDATVHDNVPGWPTAGKTGTTNSNEDAWYVGYTAKLAAAVWVGYDQPRPMPGVYGGTYAGPVFRQTLEQALAGQSPVDFPRPAGVTQAPIDIKAAPWTVALPGPLTPPADVRSEWFVAGTQPTQPSGDWVRELVDPNAPSLRWDITCGDLPTTKVFLQRPPFPKATAKRLAQAVQAGWRSVVPLDVAQMPPQQSCATYQANAGSGSGG